MNWVLIISIITAKELTGKSLVAERNITSQTKFPLGWDEERVRKVLKQYEEQTNEEATAEDEGVPRIVESDQEAEQ